MSSAYFGLEFAVLQNFGALRNICEFLRDNERVFFSHTCHGVREPVEQWIPTFERYKTLTPPKILPELFVEVGGVYTLERPKTSCEFYFQMYMLGHSDIHRKGVLASKWFKASVAKSMTTPLPYSKNALWLKFLRDPKESLTDRQLLVLKQRLEGGRDELMYVHDLRHWDIVRDMLMTNSSIERIILYSSSMATKINCYADVFDSLSNRKTKTRYLDIQGKLSTRTVLAFPLVAFDLTSLTLRRLSKGVISALLSTILSRPNDAKLEIVQLDGVSLDSNAEHYLLDIMDTLPIKGLLFSETSLPSRGFTRAMSVMGNSDLDRVHFRKCNLDICEIVQCLFLPTVSDSSLKELILEGVHIPESASGALASCVESSNFLTTLSLEGCRLGPKCMKMVVQGLRASSLSTLNLVDNEIGEEAHKLFRNVGNCGTMRNLFLDACGLCSHSVQDYRRAKSVYKNNNTELHVSVKGCKLDLGPLCTARLGLDI